MTDLGLTFYAGTGVLHGLPVMGRAATYYYSSLIRGEDLIALPGAGLIHPESRHRQADAIVRHKSAKRGVSRRLVGGHSQGAIEALEDAIDHPEVEAAICMCGPLDGSDRASTWFPFSGVRGMIPGSRHLHKLRQRTDRMLDERSTPPMLHLMAAHHDGLVDCQSAWAVSPNYPESRIRRYCVSHGDPGHPEAEWIETPWGFDNHFTAIWAQPVMELVRGILLEFLPSDTLAPAELAIA